MMQNFCRRFWLLLIMLACGSGYFSAAASQASVQQSTPGNQPSPASPGALSLSDKQWYSRCSDGSTTIHLYFFWSKKCPHCLNAQPFVRRLAAEYPWLQVHSLELTEHPENVKLYIEMAAQLGQQARSVPAFLWCGRMSVGYDNERGMGQILKKQLNDCYQQHTQAKKAASGASQSPQAMPQIAVPLLGKMDFKQFSLPVFTLILAGLDAFNPCAFFVLLFLLSLLVHAKNRSRMLFIGGIFVFFSGLLYFLFMAAWLNVFLLMGQINAITYVAGALAVVFAVINVKDFFWFKQGVSLSIPDSVKPGLFARMRGVVNSNNAYTMVLAAMGLAAFANLYEFLCTAGFPMVFTRILTLNDLSPMAYYFYLLFYNIVYIVPLLLIVILFSFTLGAKKLQEHQGRVLKLLSGLMMLSLGMVLLIQPDWLNNVGVAVLLLMLALLVTYLVTFLERRIARGVSNK
jgi:thiol-disulfide isomerase/thioredoxin